MDALTFWLAVALLIVSITLFYMTRRAHRAERTGARQRRQIKWLLENMVAGEAGPRHRHLLDHEFRELTQWLA